MGFQLVYADRVKDALYGSAPDDATAYGIENTSTPTVSGYKTFIGEGNLEASSDNTPCFYYLAEDDTSTWEVGIGYISGFASSRQINRQLILRSTNSDAAVDWTGLTGITISLIAAADAHSHLNGIALYAATTDATPTDMEALEDGSGIVLSRYGLYSTDALAHLITVMCRQTAGTAGSVGDSYAGHFLVVTEPTSGLVGSSTLGSVTSAGMSVSVGFTSSASTEFDITVTGEANRTLGWKAVVQQIVFP